MQVVIIVVEMDIPVLTVQIPESVVTQKVNLNDQLKVSILYDKNPDDVFFSLILFYRFDLVATKSYRFTSFAFKIWDLFNDIVPSEQSLLLRISLYDPIYFMPLQSSYSLTINLPPWGGQIAISPVSGNSLATQFTVSLQGYKGTKLIQIFYELLINHIFVVFY